MSLVVDKKQDGDSIDYRVSDAETLLFWAFKYQDFTVTAWYVPPSLDRRTHLSRIKGFARVLETHGLPPSGRKHVGIFVAHSPISIEITTSVDGEELEKRLLTAPNTGFFNVRFATPYGDAVYEHWDAQKQLYCVASHLQIAEPVSAFMEETSIHTLPAEYVRPILGEIYMF